ncbi:transcriptional regulator [Microbacterium testaceum]|jgi:two-component system, OmpR family, response regulator|uniref:Transcriptional regulator n=1 Tax=Microbacterium testaceum TaxID=2033 RepID=A0A147F510_MICTE|nr:response regulator transcription factor [Microbacterium testaceum]KTS09342.1 transcriptional regulator [Microbacterium testaceum]KTS62343.1 transcriptional regulator [Microbacterium testaceum]KTS90512.1 transcriptional regulator [Microbacterium testaceum]
MLALVTFRPAPLTRPDGSPIRVLVVDDEANLSDLLRMALQNEGWDARTAANGQEALNVIREFGPDLLVLDIMMPGLDGMELLTRIRAAGNDAPVLFLTAKDAVEDRIAGISAGADDYVTKPFNLEEVVVRLRGMARRHVAAIADADPRLRVGDLSLDEESYEVERGGIPIKLTAKEFELLRYLMQNPRRVLSKSQILDQVWSYDFGGNGSVVEIYISYLRKKIDSLGEPLIHTVRGVGYTIKAS